MKKMPVDMPDADAYLRILQEEEHNLEVLLLRCHLLIERELVRLLATRLLTDIDALPPRISFELLTRLALARREDAELRVALLRLNKVRNNLAHVFEYETLEADLLQLYDSLKLTCSDWFDKIRSVTKPIPMLILALTCKILDTAIAAHDNKIAFLQQELEKASSE